MIRIETWDICKLEMMGNRDNIVNKKKKRKAADLRIIEGLAGLGSSSLFTCAFVKNFLDLGKNLGFPVTHIVCGKALEGSKMDLWTRKTNENRINLVTPMKLAENTEDDYIYMGNKRE